MNGSVGTFFFLSFLFPFLSLFLVFHVHARKEKKNLQPIRCLGKSEFVNKFIHDAINTDRTTDEFQRRILGITKDEVIAIEIGEIRTSDSARELFIHRYMYSQGQPKEELIIIIIIKKNRRKNKKKQKKKKISPWEHD